MHRTVCPLMENGLQVMTRDKHRNLRSQESGMELYRVDGHLVDYSLFTEI